MTTDNPDMSGNWADLPFYCDQCDKQIREEDAYGIPAHPQSTDDERMFCSGECAEEWLEAQRPE